MARPRASDYDDKRRAILDRSAELFARSGFDRTSMSQIADACGVSKGLLYHYYQNKDALLFDIIERHLAELIEAVEAAETTGVDAKADLRALIFALLEAYRDADAEHKVQINDLSKLAVEQQEALKALERRLVSIFSEAIAAANPGLGDPSRLLKPVTMALFGMINWSYMWFREGGALTREDYADIVARLIIEGSKGL
ncbi:MAG TPA: TetR/AcrR family transcriptional regulator [Hyphomicrobiales bacterium]|nr:TetR/AcrR family transcriptional regulator [Hyphomicrobiales bacterium]